MWRKIWWPHTDILDPQNTQKELVAILFLQSFTIKIDYYPSLDKFDEIQKKVYLRKGRHASKRSYLVNVRNPVEKQ